MLEIDKLEREWLRYRLKRIKPWIFLSITLLLTVATAVWVTKSGYNSTLKGGGNEKVKIAVQTAATATDASSNVESVSATVEKESVTKSEKVVERKPKEAVSQTAPQEKETTKEQMRSAEAGEPGVILNPDTGFMESLSAPKKERRPQKVYRAVETAREETVSSSTIDRPKSSTVEKSADTETEVKKKNSENTGGSGLQILSTKTNNTLQLLIKRFNRNNDPKLASYIAQSYYKKGDYKEAVKWSVAANSLDPSGEESWLIFARAKVKLGKRDEAVKALRVYLNQYSSRKVRSYLRRLESKE